MPDEVKPVSIVALDQSELALRLAVAMLQASPSEGVSTAEALGDLFERSPEFYGDVFRASRAAIDYFIEVFQAQMSPEEFSVQIMEPPSGHIH